MHSKIFRPLSPTNLFLPVGFVILAPTSSTLLFCSPYFSPRARQIHHAYRQIPQLSPNHPSLFPPLLPSPFFPSLFSLFLSFSFLSPSSFLSLFLLPAAPL